MTAPRRELIVLFDGECNLCNRSVQFIIRRDRRGRFKFAPLQWAIAKQLTERTESAGSMLLIENGKTHRESTAALRICKNLRFPWPILSALIVIPRPIRDFAYRWIARNRYRWFGKREACMVPTEELSARFLSE